jgi:hypothetical protein
MNVSRADTGPYNCVATNSVGRDEIEISLEVVFPPLMAGSTAQESLSVISGESFIIVCPVISQPVHQVDIHLLAFVPPHKLEFHCLADSMVPQRTAYFSINE